MARFTPCQNYVNNGGNPNFIPRIGFVVDDDDSNLPSSVESVTDRDGYREKYFNRPASIKIYPKYAVSAYAPDLTPPLGVAYAAGRRGWLDLHSDGINVKHYGLKGVIYGFNPHGQDTFHYTVQYIYYISFRKRKH